MATIKKSVFTLYITFNKKYFDHSKVICHHSVLKKQPSTGVLRKKVFYKFAANLQENTHADMWIYWMWFQYDNIEITLWYGCFVVNLLYIFRTPLFLRTSLKVCFRYSQQVQWNMASAGFFWVHLLDHQPTSYILEVFYFSIIKRE